MSRSHNLPESNGAPPWRADPVLLATVQALAAQAGETYSALDEAVFLQVPTQEQMSSKDALALTRLFQRAGHQPVEFDPAVPDRPAPIAFRLGAGGRTQIRLVVELPHEMAPLQRLELAKEFTSRYEADGLKYWAVIHAPNQHNDDRNYHLHINLYDRPCTAEFDAEKGRNVWSFEKKRRYYPKSDKWRVNRGDSKKHPAYRAKGWVKTERQRFAAISNDHLKKAGVLKRLDPRRYEEMGVQDKARTRISPAAYARERKGEITAIGVAFAKDQWDNNRASVEIIAKSDKSYEAWRRAWLRQEIRPQLGRGTPEAITVVKAATKVAQLSAAKTELVTARNALSHVAAKIESRARLKPPAKRDEADNAAIAVATELKADVSKTDRKIGLTLMKIAKAEKAYITAKRRDDQAIMDNRKREMVANMRAISRAALLEVDGPDISDMSHQPTTVTVAQSAKETESVTAPLVVADEGMPVTVRPDGMIELPDPDEEHRQRRAQRLAEAIRRRVEEQRAEHARIAASLPQEIPLPKPPPASIKPERINNDDRDGTPIVANPLYPKQPDKKFVPSAENLSGVSVGKPVIPEELEKEGLSKEAIAKLKTIQERIRQAKGRSR